MKENKKLIGVILIAVLIALSALSSSTNLSVLILNATNFTINVSGYPGQPGIDNNVTLICVGNTTCTQNNANHSITITSTGGVGNGLTNESVHPYNLKADNLTSGKVPYTRLNVTPCNPANEANTFNIATFNFDCINVADDDSAYLLISTYNGVFPNPKYDNYQGALNAMNQSNADNRTYAQQQSDNLNNSKLNKSGDTVTGALIISGWVNDSSGNAYLKNTSINCGSNVVCVKETNGTFSISALSGGGIGQATTDAMNLSVNNSQAQQDINQSTQNIYDNVTFVNKSDIMSTDFNITNVSVYYPGWIIKPVNLSNILDNDYLTASSGATNNYAQTAQNNADNSMFDFVLANPRNVTNITVQFFSNAAGDSFTHRFSIITDDYDPFFLTATNGGQLINTSVFADGSPTQHNLTFTINKRITAIRHSINRTVAGSGTLNIKYNSTFGYANDYIFANRTDYEKFKFDSINLFANKTYTQTQLNNINNTKANKTEVAIGTAFAQLNHTKSNVQTTNTLDYTGIGSNVLVLPLSTGKMVLGECDILTNASLNTISPQMFFNITGNDTMTIDVEYYTSTSVQALVSGGARNTSIIPTTSAGTLITPVRVQFHSNQTAAGFFNVSMKASAAGMVQVDRGSYCRSIEI